MKKQIVLWCMAFTACSTLLAQTESSKTNSPLKQKLEEGYVVKSSTDGNANKLDSIHEIVEVLNNLPNIEVGKGITFKPNNDSYRLTIRFRMQNMVGFYGNHDFSESETEARVKRLRLRFDGYIYTPKLTYSIQLGFTPYDAEVLPNGNMNIVRDAMVYYIPNQTWSVGFGQTKIRANRARINSSSALQFVDRSIVNSEFQIDRDFGLWGEYHKALFGDFNLSAKGSVTLGEGRNYGSSKNSGLCYTGRLELFPLGRFKSLGDVIEGDFEREDSFKLLLAGAYSFNDRAVRARGTRSTLLSNNQTRNIHAYFVDFIMKYQGWAFYADYMGRYCNLPDYIGGVIFNGNGLNVQTSYIFKNNWEIALRNSMLMPDAPVRAAVGYDLRNQTSFGVTKYIIGHSLKVQADVSYNHYTNTTLDPTRWEFRAQVELGL